MPAVKRPNTKTLYLSIDPSIYEALKYHCVKVAQRDMKTEVSFAILEHIKHGRRELPPELEPKIETTPHKPRKRKDT